jgi:hypothetical protein
MERIMSLGINDEPMNPFEELKKLVRESQCTPDQLSRAVARVFGVRSTEVGLLFRHEYFLKFLFPVELQAAGSIPLSGSAVAARTATLKRADVFNNFARVPHRSIFETIKLKDVEAPLPIQKLMSAPVLGTDGEAVGVVQISRKGDTSREAGPDFSKDNLDKLMVVATILSPYMAKLSKPQPGQAQVTLTLKPEHANFLTMPTSVAS